MEFFGEPSISLSEYARYTSVFDSSSYIRTTWSDLKSIEVLFENTSLCFERSRQPSAWVFPQTALIDPVCRQAIDASDGSSARPTTLAAPPFFARLTWHVMPETSGSWKPETTILSFGVMTLKTVLTSPTSHAKARKASNDSRILVIKHLFIFQFLSHSDFRDDMSTEYNSFYAFVCQCVF